MTDDIFDKIKSKQMNEKQLDELGALYINSGNYSRMFIAINEFITDMEYVDKTKIKEKTEALLRTYPSTLISALNKTEKWYLFNNLAHLFLTMAINDIESIL